MCCQLETPEFVRLFCLLRVAAAPPPAWPSSPGWVTLSSQQLGLVARSAVLGTCGNPSRQVSKTAPVWMGMSRQGRDISRDRVSSNSFVFQSSQERMLPLWAGLVEGHHSRTILWFCEAPVQLCMHPSTAQTFLLSELSRCFYRGK